MTFLLPPGIKGLNTKGKDYKSCENLCAKNFTLTKKFYVRKIAAVNLSKSYFLKNGKKTCEYLNRDWITQSRGFLSTFHFYEYKILLSSCIMLFIRYAESGVQSLSVNMISRWKWNPQRWLWWRPFPCWLLYG